jgi:hypothetical protein
MDKILGAFNHPTLNQEAINHLGRYKTSNEIEAVINNLATKRSPGAEGFTAKLYQTFQEELLPILFILFHEIEREGLLPNSSLKPVSQSFQNWTRTQPKKSIDQSL